MKSVSVRVIASLAVVAGSLAAPMVQAAAPAPGVAAQQVLPAGGSTSGQRVEATNTGAAVGNIGNGAGRVASLDGALAFLPKSQVGASVLALLALVVFFATRRRQD